MPVSLKSGLLNIVSELKWMKQSGVSSLFISTETLSSLQALREKFAKPKSQVAQETARTEAPKAAVEPTPSIAPIIEKEKYKTAVQTPQENTSPSLPEPPSINLPEGNKSTQWNFLKSQVENCPVCKSRLTPHGKIVFGTGSLNADILFCGEAPGEEEEISGEPFTGPSGQLLSKIIKAAGLDRNDVYLANVMNWRPTTPAANGTQQALPEEMKFCLPYFIKQVEIIKPKVIVALGNSAVNGLLGVEPNRKLKDIRGKWSDFQGTPLMVSYHPSYLLRNGTNRTKRISWEDIMQVMEKVGLPISDKQKQYFL